ncbi:hypothetical protein LCGC14_1025710 [marine sediment metagenome]|uniref:Uncharacterized protein n=1 Tax=marine sediment metagenome TaxID=412755 RepID=A0A0F9QE52_9ZZZZ
MNRGTYIRTPATREKNRRASLGVKQSAESNAKRGITMRAVWADPEYKERLSLIHQGHDMVAVTRASHTPEAQAKRSATMTKENKRRWADPAYKARVVKAIRSVERPNKAEKLLAEILGDAWNFVGNGDLIINGKCPDFQSRTNPNQLLELFGDYWHAGEDPRDRIKEFTPYGYSVAVLWEHDLRRL